MKSAIILLLWFVLSYLMGSTAISVGDDLGYAFADSALHAADGHRVQNITDCFTTQASHYLTTNGRFLVHLLVQIFISLLPNWVFNLLNSCMITLLILGLGRLATVPKSVTWQILVLAGCIFFLLTPEPGLIAFSLKAFAVNYVWVATAAIWIVVWWTRLSQLSVAQYTTTLFFALIAGSLQEAYSLPLCGAFFILTVCRKKYRKGRYFLFALCFTLGTLICVCAPGNFVRLNGSGATTDWLRNIKLLLEYTVVSPLILILIASILCRLLGIKVWQNVPTKILLLFCAVCCCLLMDVVVMNAARQFWPAAIYSSGVALFLIIKVVNVLSVKALYINILTWVILTITLIIYSAVFFLRLRTYTLHEQFLLQIKNTQTMLVWGDVRQSNYNRYPHLAARLSRFAPDPWQRNGLYCSLDRYTTTGLSRLFLKDGHRLQGVYPLPPQELIQMSSNILPSDSLIVHKIDAVYSYLKATPDFPHLQLRFKDSSGRLRPLTYTVYFDTTAKYIIFQTLPQDSQVIMPQKDIERVP